MQEKKLDIVTVSSGSFMTLPIKENLRLGKRPLEDVVVWHLPGAGNTTVAPASAPAPPSQIKYLRAGPGPATVPLPKTQPCPGYKVCLSDMQCACSQCFGTMFFLSQSDTCPAWSVPPPTIKHCHHASRASASAQNRLLAR